MLSRVSLSSLPLWIAPGFCSCSWWARIIFLDLFFRLLRNKIPIHFKSYHWMWFLSCRTRGETKSGRLMFPSSADLGFLHYCSGLLSQHVCFYRLAIVFALENAKLLPGVWETTHWYWVCSVGGSHKCFSFEEASLGGMEGTMLASSC